jgi:hypothetical protein
MSNFSLTPDLAAQIAQRDPVLNQNTEQGFTNTYGPGTNIPDGQLGFAVPALGMSALGLYLLYQKQQQDKKDRELEQAQEKVALTWQDVRAQLPGFHAPDILLGGAAGAGAGMLYDYIRGGEKGKRFNQALRRILTGAAIGAGATNLVGDRARRYITNSVVPAGYDGGNILAQLKPRSVQHVWDAAIKDKPSYDPEKVREFVSKFKNTEIGRRVLAARSELDRIGMGVNLHNPETSVWQQNKGDKGAPYYSLNEKNKEYLRNLAAIFLPSRLKPNSVMTQEELGLSGPPPADRKDISGLFANPHEAIKFVNKLDLSGQLQTDLFGTHPLLGAQQLVTKLTGKEGDRTKPVEGLVFDRHDVTPSAANLSDLKNNIFSGRVFDPAWRSAPVGGVYGVGKTNLQEMGAVAGRTVWDRVLRHENPWVAQKFQFSPVEGPTGEQEYGLNMLRHDNTPVFSQPMNRGDVFDYLQQLQGGDKIPELK